jgi:hypothetical protein
MAGVFVTACGAGFGAGDSGGSADLTVTRDYGYEVLVSRAVDDLTASSTAMRILDGEVEVETRYGGGFVQSIDGISGSSGSRNSDWFYYVNGVAAERGAAEFVVRPGDRMWWDFRDWTDAMDVNAVVGSYPAPLKGGYDGTTWPVVVECTEPDGEACRTVRERLEADGVTVAGTTVDAPAPSDFLRVLVGTWPSVSRDPGSPRLDRDPSVSGVFARFPPDGEPTLEALDREGAVATTYGPGAGLIAASRQGGNPPVWLVTGTDSEGVDLAAEAISEDNLRSRYAAVVTDGRISSLPASSGPPGTPP